MKAIDDDLEGRVRAILNATWPPSVALGDAELIAAAHRAFDAHDVALVAIAAHVEPIT
ncbi:MAG: hypothetical protein M3N47_07185 [Chloroflexota bacterium]|nr:hypothetical protein [Chloroflexota bacterium]